MGLDGKTPNPDDQYLDSEELMDDYQEFEYSKDKDSLGEDNYDTDAHRRDKKAPSSSPTKTVTSDHSGTITTTKPKKGPPIITGVIEDEGDIEDLKMLLQETKIGIPFNTNVLRVALNMKEESCANVLIEYYKVQCDEPMVLRAIKTVQMNFLSYMYSS